MTAEIRLLGPGDRAALDRVAPDVFDNPIDARWAAEFFADARHHLAVAVDGDLVIGMASAVHYIHPDKPPELWINEVGVAAAYQQQGIGGRLLRALFDHGRELGCGQAWVLTDWENEAARRLYASVGGREEPPDGAVLVTFELRRAES
jgi:aminoglycoside 6'-N-acetyltransferase I